MSKEVGDSESMAKWNMSLPAQFFSPFCHRVLSLCYLSEPLPLLMLGIGLAKELVWVFPYDGTEKLECTFGPTRYMACGPHLSSPQEHSVRDLVGPGPFTVLAPLSAAFDKEPQVSMKLEAGRWKSFGTRTQPLGITLEPTRKTFLNRFRISWWWPAMKGVVCRCGNPHQEKHSSGFGVTTTTTSRGHS